MTIELSSAGKKEIRLEMPEEMAYFLPSGSGPLEETAWRAQHDFFSYTYEEVKCRDFNVIRNNIRCTADCRLRSLNMDNSFLGLSAVRQGYAECLMTDEKDRRLWQKGFSNIMVCPGYKEECNFFKADEPFSMTSVLVSSDFFRHLSERYPEFFGKAYERLCRGETFFFAPRNLPVSPTLMTALNDLEMCRIMGNASRMYLEAKIIECLSGFILTAGKGPARRENMLTASERDKIYEAREIIREEYLDPPTLHQLACRVGTNECTLKAGFRKAFHQTVFDFLYDCRMQLATHYLKDTSKSIQEIASLVGYGHQGHFCTAFKRKFNLSPSEYRKFG